jgi:hypothetical protein
MPRFVLGALGVLACSELSYRPALDAGLVLRARVTRC